MCVYICRCIPLESIVLVQRTTPGAVRKLYKILHCRSRSVQRPRAVSPAHFEVVGFVCVCVT